MSAAQAKSQASPRRSPLDEGIAVGPAPKAVAPHTSRWVVWVFLAFALPYFLSALVRAVTATLSTVLSTEMALSASDLGLLAGGYFFGFALTQLPLGRWLDRYGPRRVILAFLCLAVIGCVAFATATSFTGLLLARVFIGMGVSACLMAPLTGYRRWFSPATQMRSNSWMLMTGSLGMVASTLPVQWLMPLLGWRGLFWLLAGLVLLAMVGLAALVPAWEVPAHGPGQNRAAPSFGYREIWRHPYFLQMVPVGFFNYGGMVAVQTLWAGPWMVQVAGKTPQQAAFGLFAINLSMLVAFWLWGLVNPHLARRGYRAENLIAWGVPISLVILALTLWRGTEADWPWWAAFCVSSTFVALSQPAVALALPAHAAGKALSAYNLVIFAGVFTVQWAIGLLMDALGRFGWGTVAAFQGAVGAFGLCCLCAYALFLYLLRRQPPHARD